MDANSERSQCLWPHTGAVLAGGRGSRMGRPKHTITLSNGRSMLENAALTLAAVCQKTIVVMSSEKPVSAPSSGRWRIVHDRVAHLGPLGGIEALLAEGGDSHYLIVPCDMPGLTPGLLRLLIEARPEAMAVVFQLAGEPHPRPLPARITTAALPTVQRLLREDSRAVWRAMAALQAHVVVIDAAESQQLANVNSPADLEQL